MKAITIKQPWAGLIMSGMKNIENRTWATQHRGKILIHSSKTLNYAEEKRAEDFIVREILTKEEQKTLNNDDGRIRRLCKHYGVIIGEVEIVDCVKNHSSNWAEKYTWNWVLANPIIYDEPIPAAGQLRLWNFEK